VLFWFCGGVLSGGNNYFMRVILFALFLGLGLSSCQQRLYFPDRVNSPMFTKGLEGKLTIAAKPQFNDNDWGWPMVAHFLWASMLPLAR
jgi:hypothetical protein